MVDSRNSSSLPQRRGSAAIYASTTRNLRALHLGVTVAPSLVTAVPGLGNHDLTPRRPSGDRKLPKPVSQVHHDWPGPGSLRGHRDDSDFPAT